MSGLIKNTLVCFTLIVSISILGYVPTFCNYIGLHNPDVHLVLIMAGILIWYFTASNWWYSMSDKKVESHGGYLVSKGFLTKAVHSDGTVRVYADKRFTGTQQEIEDFANEHL
jgi:hypothetical protein